MKKVMLGMIMGCLTMASAAQAGDFRDAATICETLSFSSKKNACIVKVRGFQTDYFDDQAIRVCKSMSFDNGKINCIDAIADKIYEAFEIRACAEESFDSKKNSCLSSTGQRYSRRPYPRPQPQPPRSQPSQDYVEGRTQKWINAGVFTAPKAVTERVTISVNSREAVKEVRLSAEKGGVRIVRAQGVTASGQAISLNVLEGTVGDRATRTLSLDSRYAIRLQSLELEISSEGLFGSRGRLEVLLGVTR